MAVYAHLQPGGVLVRTGQRVRRGQPIGLSGNTGFSSGPHLHFVVQVNRGMRLESIPFRMFGRRGSCDSASQQRLRGRTAVKRCCAVSRMTDWRTADLLPSALREQIRQSVPRIAPAPWR